MTLKGHKKHADIPRIDIGNYGRFEVGLIGAPCSMIHNFVSKLSEDFSPEVHITYVDADHKAAEKIKFANFTDRIAYHAMSFDRVQNEFDIRILLSASDLLIINGNHFKARHQIVFCTEKKKESLQRKLDRLTEVKLIILDEGIDEPFSFLKDHLSGQKDVPILKIDHHDEILIWFSNYYNQRIPGIKGLVLAGGKSQRMGTNKAFLNYSDQPQVYHACNQLLDTEVVPFISCREDQVELFNDRHPLLKDTFSGLGPYGAILSAFRSDPNSAWIVIACDQPLLKSDHLRELLARRNTSKIATCFHNPDTGFPEPLITLWEPRAYPRLLSFLSMGYSCPRKVLINSDIEEIYLEDNTFMKNANTPIEQEALKKIIQNFS